MFREYDTDFNIQFFDNTGLVVDYNVNYYAEDDAVGVNIWEEDNCVATLIRKGDDWVVDRVDSFYAVNDETIESDDYTEVMDFVARLEKVVELV